MTPPVALREFRKLQRRIRRLETVKRLLYRLILPLAALTWFTTRFL